MPYNDIPDYELEYQRKLLREMFPPLRLKYEQVWDFDDYKGWVAKLGMSEEATITWRGVNNEGVQSGELEPGFSWMSTADNGSQVLDGFTCLYLAQLSLEKFLFANDGKTKQ